MSKVKNHLDKKITAYIDNLFSGVGATQQLFELKEELAINIKEKTTDYQSRGMDEEKALKEVLTRETIKKYAMNKIRAALYGLSTGVLLFGFFASTVTYFAVKESFVPIAYVNGIFLTRFWITIISSINGNRTAKAGIKNVNGESVPGVLKTSGARVQVRLALFFLCIRK